MLDLDTQRRAEAIVATHTLTALRLGFIPGPAASAVIIADMATMLDHLSRVLGAEVTWASILESVGPATSIDLAGRQVVIEGARRFGWGVGGPLVAIAVCTGGATTPGLHTYLLGLVAIEIGKNDGRAVTTRATRAIIAHGRATHGAFLRRFDDHSSAAATVGMPS